MKTQYVRFIFGTALISLVTMLAYGNMRHGQSVSPSISVNHGALADTQQANAIDDELHTEMTALRQEVARLEAKIAALQTDFQTLKSPSQSLQVIETKLTGRIKSSSLSLAEIRAQEQVKEDEYWAQEAERLEADFQQQAQDPDWSASSKSSIQAALARIKIAEADIIDMDCRSSTCRIELANNSQNQVPDITLLALTLGQRLSNMRVKPTKDGSDERTTVVYLSK